MWVLSISAVHCTVTRHERTTPAKVVGFRPISGVVSCQRTWNRTLEPGIRRTNSQWVQHRKVLWELSRLTMHNPKHI
jgi:hypothetical protein